MAAAGGAAPHIFSHKGGLVQDDGALPYVPFAPAAQPPAWPRRIWQTSPGTALLYMNYFLILFYVSVSSVLCCVLGISVIKSLTPSVLSISCTTLTGSAGGNDWGGWHSAASDWGDNEPRGWRPPPPPPPPPLDAVSNFTVQFIRTFSEYCVP